MLINYFWKLFPDKSSKAQIVALIKSLIAKMWLFTKNSQKFGFKKQNSARE